MKKASLLLIAILLLPVLTLIAQEVDTLKTQTTDTTKVKFGNKIITVIEGEDDNIDINIKSDTGSDKDDVIDIVDGDECKKDRKKKKSKFDGHWGGFEFGFNGLVDADNKFPAADHDASINMVRSWTFGLNLFQKSIPLIGENFGLVTGLGMQWKNYHFDNKVNLIETEEGLQVEELTGVKIKKNRLQATYITIPLAFELQFPVGPKKSEMFLHAGGYGSFKIGSNYKTEWTENGKTFEDKTKDNFYLNNFDYGVTARIGIEDLNLFANYSMSSLFADDNGLGFEAYSPVTVGIMLIGF